MTRYVKRGGQVWNRVFPDVPVTKKPLEVRMGSGKGNVEYWVAKVAPGKVLFEIEAARRAMTRYVKRGGQVWNRVFPDVPVSKKPLEVRMGSGKGNVEYWIAKVLPGKVLFEIEGVDEATAREAFRLASAKLSVSTMFVKRQVR
jgi:large subunit ribosomal protein L16